MKTSPHNPHPSDSSIQRAAEEEILKNLELEWHVHFAGQPKIDPKVALDGFVDGDAPICVEVWAHQGKSKGGQPAKLMRDFCKLILVEKLLGKKCRKVFVACDKEALDFLDHSWQGCFAKKFDIECKVVDISIELRQQIQHAQQTQFR